MLFGNEALQLLAPILYQDQLRRCWVRLAFFNDCEALAVRCDIVISRVGKPFSEGPFKKYRGLSERDLPVSIDVHRHHLVAVTLEELAASGIPRRIGATSN